MSQACVLVVDDNAANRDLYVDLLEMTPYAAVALDNGAGVLDVVRRQRPGLILMDINLGLIPAALIFTVLHAPPIPKLLPLSVFYLGFSFLLGLLFIYTDENILLLIAVHFIYDWVVLYLLQRINFKNNLLNA